MNKKVLLIIPPWVVGEDKNLFNDVVASWPSLGLAYIAAVLERAGHSVSYLDYSAERYTVGDTVSVLGRYSEKFDFIGLTATTPTINNALAIASRAKEIFPEAKIIIGGVHASVLPDEVMASPVVDFVAIGEGEETMLELVSGQEASTILGLCYKEDGRIIKNDLRPLIPDLDSIPLPAYHLLPMDKYHPSVGFYKRLPAMLLMATRGCPGQCTFCHNTFRGRIRKRPAKKVIEEIKILQRDYKIKEIAFYDDTFTLFRDVVKEFCDIVEAEKIDITWSCFTRVDRIDEDLLRSMKRAGCHSILFGVESADEQILQNITKGISLDRVVAAVKLARRVGLETRASFMIGNQGETEETIKKTIDFAVRLDPDEMQLNITTAYPGTELFSWARERGYLKSLDWNDYVTSNVVFELPGLDKTKLQFYYELAYRKFYFRPKIILRRLSHIRTLTQLAQEVRGALILLKYAYKRFCG